MERNGSVGQHFCGHAGSPVLVSLKTPKPSWCVVCALVIQAGWHRVVETLTPAQCGVGWACLPASLFSQAGLTVLLGRPRGSSERVRFPQGAVEIVSVLRLPTVVSLLVGLQGFPTACSFFSSCSSSCCPGLVEAHLRSHLSYFLFQSMLL